ncbi:hypothetical protein CC85DRAFT_164191 [Cutaneotrichosporon oleaginosum]|uniref:Uncharacterized protein n=1 Tax=Cutaneotrichosporon oleaginosum TaxID=879819 RepID=A0A0J0XG87_9TREE|nr:uncharacterized protein CC85DRAFT_164191 [Cutaneotrichosporon oleaginosum]KLT40071.1 hypothetical protein CC85DRAFT_164191 [Cutaneotrichosporon oleaginosum]TXT10405.1 hypothetical protein COLE_04339 [Cutaneotrichosporon oleaginosum]
MARKCGMILNLAFPPDTDMAESPSWDGRSEPRTRTLMPCQLHASGLAALADLGDQLLLGSINLIICFRQSVQARFRCNRINHSECSASREPVGAAAEARIALFNRPASHHTGLRSNANEPRLAEAPRGTRYRGTEVIAIVIDLAADRFRALHSDGLVGRPILATPESLAKSGGAPRQQDGHLHCDRCDWSLWFTPRHVPRVPHRRAALGPVLSSFPPPSLRPARANHSHYSVARIAPPLPSSHASGASHHGGAPAPSIYHGLVHSSPSTPSRHPRPHPRPSPPTVSSAPARPPLAHLSRAPDLSPPRPRRPRRAPHAASLLFLQPPPPHRRAAAARGLPDDRRYAVRARRRDGYREHSLGAGTRRRRGRSLLPARGRRQGPRLGIFRREARRERLRLAQRPRRRLVRGLPRCAGRLLGRLHAPFRTCGAARARRRRLLGAVRRWRARLRARTRGARRARDPAHGEHHRARSGRDPLAAPARPGCAERAQRVPAVGVEEVGRERARAEDPVQDARAAHARMDRVFGGRRRGRVRLAAARARDRRPAVVDRRHRHGLCRRTHRRAHGAPRGCQGPA